MWRAILLIIYSISRRVCSNNNLFWLFVTFCILPVLSITACAPHSIYHDRSFNPPVYFGTHVVREGDTLYSISWRYGRDFKELAAENGISAPFVISPGQKISLERHMMAGPADSGRVKSQQSKSGIVTKGKDAYKTSANVTKIKKHKNFKDIKWQWPHIGPILAKYSNSAASSTKGAKDRGGSNSHGDVNKGIDIAGRLGDSIFAAAAGEVVYAGSGLLGYGNLVIINHNELYLSAYAHNRQILVQEGQQIKKGEKIAEMGRSSGSGLTKPMLHFEIRKNGQPVDPMKYLPRR